LTRELSCLINLYVEYTQCNRCCNHVVDDRINSLQVLLLPRAAADYCTVHYRTSL